ncbi:MAG TPA: hypothetical protein VGX96_15005 [Candidatus Elarobacter sp.]|nr:hypothetical protein [Candidatus Elarobacter sp.]
MSTNPTSNLVVNVSLPQAEPGKRAPNLRVYVFDAAQRLVQSVPAKERVELKIDPTQHYRVTLGPDLLERDGAAPAGLAKQLAATGSLSRDLDPRAKLGELALSASASALANWLFTCINVHGSVRKLLNPGGDRPQYAPICAGKVEIFRIDFAASLDRLSAADLLNLKNTAIARLTGREVSDIIGGIFGGGFGDLTTVEALIAGLAPLSGAALKAYILAHRAQLAPFICEVIPEWAISYEQYADAPIQSDGTFSSEICFPIWQSRDLYFEVVQTVDGVTREIADPDIVCTTMFGYDGSQPAVITVTDPTAIACPPDPKPGPSGLYVWPTAIGNIDLREIDGLETGAGTGLLPGNTPWGGTLPLQMQFSPDLRTSGIMYYRWSYKFDFDGSFTQISTPVTHRWQEFTLEMDGTIVIHLHGYSLGPHLIGTATNLFEVPDPLTHWIDINDPADRPFAYFDSTDNQTPGRSGMCTLKLEMFDAAGNPKPCSNAGHPGTFQYLLPKLVGPPDVYTTAPAPNIDADGNLIFRLYADNKPTHAALYHPSTQFHGTADGCGILHYSSGAEIVHQPYAATQPNNHLDWSLTITKGSEGQVGAQSGNTSSLDPADFARPASALLGECAQAAFAVNLYCAARATNGYGRQSQYDASATSAFALLTP